MPESIDEVLSEFGAFLNEEIAATAMALGGLRTLAHMVLKEVERGIDPQDSLMVGHNVPDVGWILRFDNLEGAKTYLEQVAPTGTTSRRLTQQLIVTLDTDWEEEFRRRFARARGLGDPRGVKSEFFRDIRRLRNDIVHHSGIATERNAARCTTLQRGFAVGDPIFLDDRDLLNLRSQVPWGALASGGLD